MESGQSNFDITLKETLHTKSRIFHRIAQTSHHNIIKHCSHKLDSKYLIKTQASQQLPTKITNVAITSIGLLVTKIIKQTN